MKEKVSISDINIPNNFKDIKTNYNITLYDKDTGEIVCSTDGHNKLSPNAGLHQWSLTYGSFLTSCLFVSSFENSGYSLPTGFYFYNSNDDPNSNHPGGPQRGTYVGAGKLGDSNSAATRCSYNPNESKYEIVFEDGQPYMHKHMVFDATTSQLNGEINTVVLGANRYMDVQGIFGSNFYLRGPANFSGTFYDYNYPIHCQNASLMSHHPERPAWLTPQGWDSNVYGSWSLESDNTGWFSPYKDGIASVDDIVLFHYNLKTWKVLDVVKLSLPQECIGKRLIAYKFNDCIVAYTYYSSSYSEDSNGNVQYNSNPMYVFNLNGDFVKSVGRSLYYMHYSRCLAYDGKLYYWTITSNTNYYSFIVFDPELNVLDGIRMKDYMNDSRFGAHKDYGKYAYGIAPTFISDNLTGEHIITLNGYSVSSSSYYGDNNIAWNIDKGRVEWLDNKNIYKFIYDRGAFANSSRVVCVLDGMPFMLPTSGSAGSYWPFIWYHWCKLPSPVTKTANTTMKVQIDIYYPLTSPFAFYAPPDTEASSTES